MLSIHEVGTRLIYFRRLLDLPPTMPSSYKVPCWKRLGWLTQFLLEKMTTGIGMR